MDRIASEAAVEYLTFRIDREEYAIDIRQVREIREHQAPTRIVDAPPFMTGVINLRGTIVPILDLRARLGFEPRNDAERVVVILSLEETPLGVVVDGVNDVVALPPADIRPAPEPVQSRTEAGFVRGIATLADRMLVVADLARLLAPRPGAGA